MCCIKAEIPLRFMHYPDVGFLSLLPPAPPTSGFCPSFQIPLRFMHYPDVGFLSLLPPAPPSPPPPFSSPPLRLVSWFLRSTDLQLPDVGFLFCSVPFLLTMNM
jgi:hypothetical protein